MTETIILYDIPSNASTGYKAWSPNTWKARFSLNVKNIPYKTEWVEYPDIAAVSKKAGAKPTGTKDDGSPQYTLPMIYDPTTNTAVTDSWDIAVYLDKTYPKTTTLFPSGSNALIAAFLDAFGTAVEGPLFFAIILPSWKCLNEPSAAYFRRTREAKFGKTLEEFAPPGEVGEKTWADAQAGFTQLAGWLDKNTNAYTNTGKGEGGGQQLPLVMGEVLSFADVMVGASLVWAKIVLGKDSEEWNKIRSWDGGKWGVVSDFWEKYEKVV